ncbi:MAG: hypothetical protein KME17_25320 [Cyanosarcina radialis HA8281-LM2]|jgi:hypothetical protein|nr:hypothetical protein [Cyanosarcina radialis HA8281-LM2]
MKCPENHFVNSQAFLLLMARFQSVRTRQSRLLCRSLDEINGASIEIWNQTA